MTRITIVAALIAVAAAGAVSAGTTTTIQRSMSTINGSGASCSQANDCGSCSITCPAGKAAICRLEREQAFDDLGPPVCSEPVCFCR
jgi:hypothetical protein